MASSVLPTTMLELPRELYVSICDYLSPSDLTKLAGVSKDHYLAVQQLLYYSITIPDFDRLVKLVGALTKTPAVSKLSARQRLLWQSLSDDQLRERDIARLRLVLDSSTPTTKQNVNGMLLSRCIGIVYRNSSAIKIELTLRGSWARLLSQLGSEALPGVCKLVVSVTGRRYDQTRLPYVDMMFLWDLCFSGSSFPDLREIDLDTMHALPRDRPRTLNEAAKLQSHRFAKNINFAPFAGLKRMTSVSLRFNNTLHAKVLTSLFGSSIVSQNLTRLDISYCPALSLTHDLPAVAELLTRGLLVLQHLKLHLCKLPHDWRWERDLQQYCSDIVEHPEWHLCNIVCEHSSNIKTLDLALPFVCSRMFVPSAKKPSAANMKLEFPTIPWSPYDTLPRRLLDAGYQYRRLISWHGICRGLDEWDCIASLASNQGDNVSSEIINAANKSASWHMSDCLPLTYKSRNVLKRKLAQEVE